MLGPQIQRALRAVPLGGAEIEQAIKQIPGLESTGAQLAGSIHQAVLSGGSLTRAIADALHGSSWFGHPLHPALTDIPIGAWVMAAFFDASAAMGGGAAAESAADTLLAVGAAAAVPTALAGMADYSAIDDTAIAIGAAHGLLNSAGLGLYLLSMWARARGRRSQGVLLSTLGLSMVGASAALGGDMVYRRKIGVDHTPDVAAPEQWTAVLPLNQIAPYEARRVEVDGAPALLYNDGSSIYAIGAVCSHAGAPLEDGTFDGHCVECPWHQSVFDLRNGQVVHGPATQPQPNYATRVRDGKIEIRKAAADEIKSARAADAGAGQARAVGK